MGRPFSLRGRFNAIVIQPSGGGGGPSGPSTFTVMTRQYAAGVLLFDAVFQRPDGFVAPASAVDEAHMPCIGFVMSLDDPSPGLCQVQQSGDLAGFFGLVAGQQYIVSKNLGLLLWEGAEGDPNYPHAYDPGSVVQGVGIAANSTTLNIQLRLKEVN